MGFAAFYDQYPVGYASASAGKWNRRRFKELSLCCVCTSEVALQHCSLSVAGRSPGRKGCATKVRLGSVTLMTVHSSSPPVCQAFLRSPLNSDGSFYHQWKARRAMMCHPGINLPPLQLKVNKLSEPLHAADDVSAMCLSITNDLSANWFPPFISQERHHSAAVTSCLGEICATCHLSDTHCTEKSQIGCVLSKFWSAWGEG